jgi:hypothetical protein
MAFPIGAVIGGASALLGGIGAAKANKAADRAAENQYKYDTANYNYQWEQTQREYDYRLKDTGIQRQNNDDNARYFEASAVRDYQNNLAIRDYDYSNQMRQFGESEKIYGLQLGYNNQAAQVAYEAENRKFQESLTSMAFDQQDMLVKMLQEEGQLQARGVSGRSAGKTLASAMAGYGRNQAILAESLVSANKESNVSRRQIATEKYGADLNANSRRMLQPLRAPDPVVPLSMPRATIQDPLKPERGPAPIKGASGSSGALGIISGAVSGFTSGYSLGKSFNG